MCLAAWMSTRARHTLIRKTMFTGRVTGDNSICLANWKIWCMHVRVCVCVCLHESTGSDWLVGWLFGWRLAYLLFFFCSLAFDMSKTSVFRLKSLFRFFSQNYANTQGRCCFGSLLFFIFFSLILMQRLAKIIWHSCLAKKRQNGRQEPMELQRIPRDDKK